VWWRVDLGGKMEKLKKINILGVTVPIYISMGRLPFRWPG
jgi:hypothetical protein